MSDRILAGISILGLIAYFLPLILLVPEPALILVLCIVILLAVYDFWRELRQQPKKEETLEDIL